LTTNRYKAALATLRTKLGNAHSAVGITLHNIAQLLQKLTRYAAARSAEMEAYNIFDRSLGPAHHYTIAAKASIDELNRSMSDFISSTEVLDC
jgi:hypothetical protein